MLNGYIYITWPKGNTNYDRYTSMSTHTFDAIAQMNTALAYDVDTFGIRESEYRKTFFGLIMYGNETSIVAFGRRSRKL